MYVQWEGERGRDVKIIDLTLFAEWELDIHVKYTHDIKFVTNILVEIHANQFSATYIGSVLDNNSRKKTKLPMCICMED